MAERSWLIKVVALCHLCFVPSGQSYRLWFGNRIQSKLSTFPYHGQGTCLSSMVSTKDLTPWKKDDRSLDYVRDDFAALNINSTSIVPFNDAIAKWKSLCIEQNRPHEIENFSIEKVLPHLPGANTDVVELVLSNDNREVENIFVTEEELERLWTASSMLAFGKGIEKFTIHEALLLLNDEDELAIMGNNEASEEKEAFMISMHTGGESGEDFDLEVEASSLVMTSELGPDDIPLMEIVEPVVELFVTEEELKRVWKERAEISWGMPAKKFSSRMALLLLDDEDDDDFDDDIEYVTATESVVDEDDESGLWSNYPGEGNRELRAALKAIYMDLEDTSPLSTPWQKQTHFMTPDTDTQKFFGDIMQGGSFMYTRVPANWDDPEEDEMSDTYKSTTTMAWPGEPETNYNLREPIWKNLNLPEYAPDVLMPNWAKGMMEEVGGDLAVAPSAGTDADDGPVDWETFDFSLIDSDARPSGLGLAIPAPVGDPGDDGFDIDTFFQSVEGTAGATAAAAVSPLQDGIAEDDESDPEDDNFYARMRHELRFSTQRSGTRDFSVTKNFVTPPEWLSAPEFANHVDFEVWSQYPDEDFDRQDYWRPDDEATKRCVEHVMKMTDLYLTDHVAVRKAVAHRDYIERLVDAKLMGTKVDPMPIPKFLTPDIDRGVKYGNDIIEMKGKMTLAVWRPPPAVEWANDTFTHNEDLVTLNKIGTIRDQYDWAPQGDPADHAIDEEVLRQIQPVLAMVNHAAELVSTKDNILTFNYKSQMRHLIGIRGMLLDVAKKCFPQVVDVRLETNRKHDKFDI